MSNPVRDGYNAALLELAAEFDEGFAYERERYLSSFPEADLQWMHRALTRAAVFQQLARMCRERATANSGPKMPIATGRVSG